MCIENDFSCQFFSLSFITLILFLRMNTPPNISPDYLPNDNQSSHKQVYSIFDQERLTLWLKEHNLPAFRKKQIYTEICANSVISFEEMTTLPKELRTILSDYFYIMPFRVDSVHESPESTKIGFSLNNGSIIESVVMFHYHEKQDHQSNHY